MTRHPVSRPVSHRWVGVLALAMLSACGGGGGSNPEVVPPPGGTAGALAAARPGDLAAWAQGRLRALDAQSRLSSGSVIGVGLPMPTAAPSGAAGATPPSSRTLVQEDGIDEADLLRSSGRHLHAFTYDGDGEPVLLAQSLDDGGRLGTPTRVSLAKDGAATLQAEGLIGRSDGQALVAVSRRWEPVAGSDICPECMTIAPIWMKSGVQLQFIDTRDAAAPVAGTRLSIEGSLVDVRRVGDTLVVVAVHRPALAVQALPAGAPAALRAAAIARVRADELLPTVRRNGGAAAPLLRETDCWLQGDNGSLALQLTTVTLVNLADPALPQSSRCFAGGTEAVYLTARNLWLATTRSAPLVESLSVLAPPPMRTDVHQFSLDLSGTGGLAWRGSAVVEGHLGWDSSRKSYRLSEHEGHLRVLTFTGMDGWGVLGDAATRAASPARLTVLRADSAASSSDGRTLATVGVLPNERRPAAIGKPGEQLFGVRFVGTRGYAVTFRRIDPLYVLDVADPADPKIAGEVELPGFSQTLLPLDNGLLLGLGRAADDRGFQLGLQLTLFDVADASAPRVLNTLVLGDAGSYSTLETSRHGLTMRVDGPVARLAMPVLLTQGDWTRYQRGLQTFEVDTAARTLTARSLLGARADAGLGWLGDERALLIGEHAVHLQDRMLNAYSW